MTTNTVRQYCGKCCGEAAKAGRLVQLTSVSEYPLCSLCESRIRNGLVHYEPSNGSEFDYFMSACERCRHFTGETDDPKKTACTWKVLDQLLNGMCYGRDHITRWYDPANLDPKTCPATCKRFTPKDDPHGELRDPPPPDVKGQMFLGEQHEVTEHVPTQAPATA